MPAIQYQRILVPLNGSATAEAALSHAGHLARIERATLTLLFVNTSLDEIRGFVGQIVSIDAMWEARRAAALKYHEIPVTHLAFLLCRAIPSLKHQPEK